MSSDEAASPSLSSPIEWSEHCSQRGFVNVTPSRARELEAGFKESRNVGDALVGQMSEVPGAEGVIWRSGCSKVLRYHCGWYFEDDYGLWCACASQVCAMLEKAAAAGHDRVSDGERSYDLRGLTQRNESSKRTRAMMRIVNAGAATCGPTPASWGYETPSGTVVVMYPPVRDFIEGQFKLHIDGFEAEAPVPGFEARTVSLECHFRDSQFGMATRVNGGARCPLLRFRPTWLRQTDSCAWEPLPRDLALHLSMGFATHHTDYVHGDAKYDLENFEEVADDFSRRRLLFVQHANEGMNSTKLADLKHVVPPVYERLMKAADPAIPADQLRAECHSGSRLACGLAVMNVLHRAEVVVKGGPIRDMCVLDDGDFKDIDCECPSWLMRPSFEVWISALLRSLTETLFVTVKEYGDSKLYKTRTTFGAITKKPIPVGAATILITTPHEVEIELITPWNTDYSPPRNVDQSMNNLKIDGAVPNEVGLIVPLGPRLTPLRIIQETMRKQTRSVYDIEFVEDATGGDGLDGSKKCQAKAPTETRRKRMQDRLDKFRSRGFRYLELTM